MEWTDLGGQKAERQNPGSSQAIFRPNAGLTGGPLDSFHICPWYPTMDMLFEPMQVTSILQEDCQFSLKERL